MKNPYKSLTHLEHRAGGTVAYATNSAGEWEMTGFTRPAPSNFASLVHVRRILKHSYRVDVSQSRWCIGWDITLPGESSPTFTIGKSPTLGLWGIYRNKRDGKDQPINTEASTDWLEAWMMARLPLSTQPKPKP